MQHSDDSGDRPRAGEAPDRTERARAEQVRAARAARHRRWADLQVEEAMRRGDFEGLRGTGRPLDLSDRHDPNWWVKKLIAREKIDVASPPAIALRLEDERLDAVLDAEATEREVRRHVADFNRRVIDARRQLLGGPPVITALRDADEEVARWRARRDERRAAYAARQAEQAEQAASAARRRDGRRGGRRGVAARLRRRRGRDDRGRDEDGRSRVLVALAAGTATALAVGVGIAVSGSGGSPDGPATDAAAPAPTGEPASPPAASPSPPPDDTATPARTRCSQGRGPFRPTEVSIPGVDRAIEVVYPARLDSGIPGTPALTSEGKAQMAFDTANRIAPGAPEGNALFNAHTWPDGSALGNALLQDLRVGDALRVRGGDGRTQCYRLARRVQVPATVSGAQYYRRTGDPRMAIVVCSGDRDAAGNWSHRTLFFAAPVA